MKRRILTILLAAMMALSMFGGAALADHEGTSGCKAFGQNIKASTKNLEPNRGQVVSEIAQEDGGFNGAVKHTMGLQCD